MKNKNFMLILMGILLFIFILAVSFLWYSIFNKSDNYIKMPVLVISLNEDNKELSTQSLLPMTDAEATSLGAYMFTIKNRGDADGNYMVILEDKTGNGYLERKYLRYDLRINGNIISKGSLEELEDNVLDHRSISANKVNNYELRLWIAEDSPTTSWLNKEYSYSIKVKTVVEDK